MVKIILVLLVLLWLLGFIQIPLLNSLIIPVFRYPFTVQNILFLILIIWIINILPGIFRTIAAIILFFWILSVFGVLSIAGLSNILILILIFAIIFSLF